VNIVVNDNLELAMDKANELMMLHPEMTTDEAIAEAMLLIDQEN